MTHIFNTAPWSWVGQPPQRRGRRARAGNYRRPLAIRDTVIAGAFGREVRRLRKARGMTGQRLAELVALSAPNISQIEHDRRQHVTLRHMWDFAEALNVTPEHFVVVIRKADRGPYGAVSQRSDDRAVAGIERPSATLSLIRDRAARRDLGFAVVTPGCLRQALRAKGRATPLSGLQPIPKPSSRRAENGVCDAVAFRGRRLAPPPFPCDPFFDHLYCSVQYKPSRGMMRVRVRTGDRQNQFGRQQANPIIGKVTAIGEHITQESAGNSHLPGEGGRFDLFFSEPRADDRRNPSRFRIACRAAINSINTHFDRTSVVVGQRIMP
jgi:transcriptional regulator with XRE-family HTH domain